MFWDGLLIVIFAYNILRSARRGGRAVGIELAAFGLTYAATLSLSPVLTQWVRSHLASPPPFLSVFSIIVVFFVSRRFLRAAFRPYLLPPLREQWKCRPQSRGSKAWGAWLGGLRGAIVATAAALIGFNIGIMQQAGYFKMLPAAHESAAIRSAERVVDLVVGRYTRDAGPTTRQLVDFTLHRDEGTRKALLNGPFVASIKRSDELKELVNDREFRELADARRTIGMITHPAFLRMVSFAVRELRNEKRLVVLETNSSES